ncbi:2-dehydro-3-deoxygalactonokinase [Achromobacter sp. Marseille-Q0513]|uniref:2-dehydro-3-deoxygalactonokinase n=1 Tax=Achromobacter sp. Marseille-Q0513 TaxID=2829161 RepID=UPI001B93686B|nr:2-dehydro-3-deoxygalactonokinase [Achromobacter sp. Marseille-Q0513]MBR8651820.1 2-dehydro-3-deoxygalactonokinase [Achromobacter sp. Marseille-Q0513]
MTSATPARAALIALDWGTSSLRAYRLDGAGRTLDARHLPWGIMRLPQPLQDGAATPALSGFELAFEQACGDWLRAEPALPVIACGMVGSAQGWQEAAYLDVPVDLDRIGTLLTVVERPGATPVRIVPGLIQRHGLPNVMRGEETQVFGVLRDANAIPDAGLLIGLPGTHSKWVGARNGQVTHFDTFMTGEVYAALRGHTILGRTMSDAAAPDMAAFERGVKVAGAPEGRAGVLSTIFSTRALGLTGELAPASQADYLSGLLIGHEIAALAAMLRAQGQAPRIVLCGEPALCERYTLAMTHYGLGAPEQAQNATERGLWHLALAAGLVPSSSISA